MTDHHPLLVRAEQLARERKSLMCVNLDPDVHQLPSQFKDTAHPQLAWNKWVIDQTHDLVIAYKPNLAFYEALGVAGWQMLVETVHYIRQRDPQILIIADAKRGDIGPTNQGYAQAVFDELGCDAVTLHPYLGQEALQPFLNRKDKLSIILCRTSNPGAGEFQDLVDQQSGQPLWATVAARVSQEWNVHQNCLLVVGATYPEELAKIRQIVGDEMWLLVPGIGAQGGEMSAVMKKGATAQGLGMFIAVGRSVLLAANPRQALLETMADHFSQI